MVFRGGHAAGRAPTARAWGGICGRRARAVGAIVMNGRWNHVARVGPAAARSPVRIVPIDPIAAAAIGSRRGRRRPPRRPGDHADA